MVKKVLMIIAEKSEASEVVVPVDILRNTDGIEVTIASVHGKEPVKVSAGIMITPDVSLSDLESFKFDAIILPGGEGHVHLEKSELVGSILRNQYESGKIVATICMGSNVLLAFSIGLGSKITSYPFNNNNAELMDKYEYVLNDVVQDKNMITPRGPGTVYAFALKIVENLVGHSVAKIRAEANLIFDLY